MPGMRQGHGGFLPGERNRMRRIAHAGRLMSARHVDGYNTRL